MLGINFKIRKFTKSNFSKFGLHFTGRDFGRWSFN
jgi:hypothetical protein